MKKEKMMVFVGVLAVLGLQGAVIHKLENQVDSQQSKITAMKKDNYEFAVGKRSMKLENGQFIKTNKFNMQYIEREDGRWSAVIYPKNNSRILGQQGDGAKGLEMVNVPITDQGLTTIQDKK